MKAATNDIRLLNGVLLSCAPVPQSPCMSSERALHSSDAIADGDNGGHRDGSTDSVTANSSSCATLVAMVQTTDLWKGNNVACRRRLYGPRLWTILS